jgi:hypothetical protein
MNTRRRNPAARRAPRAHVNTRAASSRVAFVAFVAFVALVAVRAPARAQVRELASPAGEGSGQASLTVDGRGRVYLSWIDRLADGVFALRFSVREGGGWSQPRKIAEGRGWFVNWADFPSFAALPDGSLAANWRVKNGDSPYATDIYISRSFDGGRTWSKPFTPHRDGTQTEHGFVSMFPARAGALGAIWLDGREMKQSKMGHGHGDMTLRFGAFAPGGAASAESVLDARVCECCQTSAAPTRDGAVVVYRDRSDEGLRDIGVVRLARGRWTTPRVLHRDGWKIDACPVNGPAAASDGGARVAVAWFTNAGDKPAVRLAFSADQGETFSAPATVSDANPAGRVDVQLAPDGSAVVCWLERTGQGGELRARRLWPDGRSSRAVTIAAPGAARSNGVPQMVRAGRTLVFAWISTRVLTAEMPLDALARS